MTILRKNLWSIFIALFSFSYLFGEFALATGIKNAKEGLNKTAETGFGSVDKESLSSKIGNVIGVVLSFVGVIFLVLIIYAGFTWMLARGNEAEVKKAKDLMFDAVIGLVVILSAYAITSFVGNNLAK